MMRRWPGPAAATLRKGVQCIAAVAATGVAWLAPTAVEAQTAPDLVLYGPLGEESVEPGEIFRMVSGVHNLGDGESAATTLRAYPSTDAMITTSDTLVHTESLRALGPSADHS